MHRATFTWSQRRTCAGSGCPARTRTLENWLTRYRTSRSWTRGRSRLRGWRSLARRRLVNRTRTRVRYDHARRRCLRPRRRNRRRWFRCYRSCRLWRRRCRRDRSSWSCSLGCGRRRNRRMRWWRGWRSSRSGRRWLCRWWHRNSKCRPWSRCRNDHPGRRNGGSRRRCLHGHR